jgi:hypothetical protein
MASLLSVNGKLESLYHRIMPDEERSMGYKEVGISEPLVLRYLYFFIKYKEREKTREVMISTHLKTEEEKQAAAEAINYYNPKTKFDRNKYFNFSDFGAQHYGHELLYYTKSYLGESIRITAKIMELDGVNKNLLKAIKKGISTVAGLPIFAEFLPYAALANTGISIFGKLAEILNRDDAIVKGHDLDLHFRRSHAKLLQSGRVVCIPGKNDSDFLNKFKLASDNRLVKINNDNEEFRDSTYFVMQVNNERNDLYDNYDYFQNAANLLGRTNRGDDPREFVDGVVSMAKGYNDIKSMEQIEKLSPRNDAESKKMIQALYNSMSSDMQILYSSRVKELLD